MLAAALQAQQNAEANARPIRPRRPTVDAAGIALDGIQQLRTGRGERVILGRGGGRSHGLGRDGSVSAARVEGRGVGRCRTDLFELGGGTLKEAVAAGIGIVAVFVGLLLMVLLLLVLRG